jgi:hypothetical protein
MGGSTTGGFTIGGFTIGGNGGGGGGGGGGGKTGRSGIFGSTTSGGAAATFPMSCTVVSAMELPPDLDGGSRSLPCQIYLMNVVIQITKWTAAVQPVICITVFAAFMCSFNYRWPYLQCRPRFPSRKGRIPYRIAWAGGSG